MKVKSTPTKSEMYRKEMQLLFPFIFSAQIELEKKKAKKKAVVTMKLMVLLLLLSLSIVACSLASERKGLLRIDAGSPVLRKHDEVYYSTFRDKSKSLWKSLIDEGEMSRLLGEENSWQRKMSLSFDSSFPSSSVTPTSFSHVTMIPVEPNPPNFANNSSAVPIHSPHAVSLPNSKGSPAPQQQASPGNSQPLAPTKSTGPSTSAPARSTAPFLPTQSMKPVSFAPFSPPNNTAIPVMDSAPPNFANAGSSAPSFAPGRTPTISPEMFDSDPPSIVPNTNMSPTQAQNNSILTCTDVGSVGLAETPGEARTTLTFKVGYLVESFESLTDFIDDIEKRIVLTAVLGALQCNTSGLLTNGTTDSDELFSGVVITTNGRGDNCTSEISVCTVLETEFTVYVSNEVDPEVGAFLGFVMLRQEMDNGSFESSTIDRCQYLSPLPLLPPIIEKEKTSGADSFPDVQSEDNISVSPWTLGAVLAMSAGGLVALVAWLRNRINRNRRHMQLIEDLSATSQAA